MEYVKMVNASLDSFKLQCNSKVFKFEPRSSVKVPLDLVDFMMNQLRDKGVFPVYPTMTAEQVKSAERSALISYLNGALRERIINYYSQQDDYKKRGVTLQDDPRFKRALRWDKEIRAKLELESPIEEELSFLNADQRKSIGINDDNIKHQEDAALNIFDPDFILESNGYKSQKNDEVVEKPRRGRKPAPSSFKDTDIMSDMEA